LELGKRGKLTERVEEAKRLMAIRREVKANKQTLTTG